MVGKTYLRYIVGPQGGAVASNASLSLCSVVAQASYAPTTTTTRARDAHGSRSRGGNRSVGSAVIFSASLEAVRVYSVRSGALQHTLIPAEAKMPLEVTTIRVVPLDVAVNSSSIKYQQQYQENCSIEQGGWMLLVGYHNGHVAVFSCGPTSNYGLPVCRFYALGHRSDTAVLALAVDTQRSFMYSGGQDTDLTVWDLVTQEASFRLRGHRGGIVGVEFVPQDQQQRHQKAQMLVVTGAADGLIKIWDVSIRQCVQTIVASDGQLSSLRIDSTGRRLYCGLRENQLKVFNTEALMLGTPDAASEEGSAMSTMVVEHGGIPRKLHKPITFLSFSHDGAFLLACTSKTVEIFHILSREDVRKKVARKRKRRDGKKNTGENGEDDEEAVGANGVRDKGADRSVRDGSNKKKKRVRENGDGDGSRTKEQKGSCEDDDDDAFDNNDGTTTHGGAAVAAASATEEVSLLRTFFFDDKVRSACFVPPASAAAGGGGGGVNRLHIAVTFNNNTVRTFTTALTTSALQGGATWTLEDLVLRHSMDHRGHHSDIRALAFVEDDTALLSLSAEKLTMWNVSVNASYDGIEEDPCDFYDAVEANVRRDDKAGSLTCTAQVSFDNAVAMAAISANICCVGLQDGTILLVDLPAAEVIFSEPLVHVGGVRHVVQQPDNGGFVSIGADRRLIVWTLALLKESRAGKPNTTAGCSSKHNGNGNRGQGEQGDDEKMCTSTPQLLQSAVIELTESPLFLAFSPDKRFFAVGLQNTNIQLFFGDTMKQYLSLFGHKLPPTAAAFSSDGTLIASVGMDKALRLWGTDFGDCHRAIHAHDDYVTHVSFLRDTHQLLTVSLDGSVKHWDGDNWTMIQMFRQHQRGVWAVAATANSTCLATAGVDKCIRCFLRTSDIVFPEEEEERMAREAMDEEVAKRAALQNLEQQNPEVGVAGQPTASTAAAAEKLMEALDLVSVELQRRENTEDIAPPHPLLVNKSPWEYLWSIIESVRPSEVRHALSSLTSTHVDALLNYLERMLRERVVLNYEIAAKILLSLVAPPPTAAVAGGYNPRAAIAGEVSEVHGARRLSALRYMIAQGLDHSVGRMDYNIAGLQFVRQVVEEGEKMRFFDLSKIQGHKKKYHTRALASGN